MNLAATKPISFRLPTFDRVHLTLVGCGGTGSHIASGLIAIAQALAGRNIGVEMLFVDGDRVEEKNVGRQLFSGSDVGKFKAEVLAMRLNAAFGARIGSLNRFIDAQDALISRPSGDWNSMVGIVIGAVDNLAARALIANRVDNEHGRLFWLDCGNERASGQVLLGNSANKDHFKGAVALGLVDRLPAPHLIYPDLISISTKAKKEKRKSKVKPKPPSCAELTAAGEQSLMVNRVVAGYALSMLHDFLLGQLRYFGLAFDLGWGGTRAWTLDLPGLAEVTGLAQSELEHGKR